jgi:branched-chain amino acid aminotransferase
MTGAVASHTDPTKVGPSGCAAPPPSGYRPNVTDFLVERSPHPSAEADRQRALADPGFGTVFTDHMATAVWSTDAGWHEHRVGPLRSFAMHPASAVLHYAQEIFEGLKAYRHADGSVWLFRPEANAARFARSAQRLAMPMLDEATFVDAIQQLVAVDRAWVPAYDGDASLYLRPFMFASEAFLGVRVAGEVTYCVIATPATNFLSSPAGIALWVSGTFARAAPGGTGEAKCGGNYAAGLAAEATAHEHGAEHVLYLDACEHEWLDEAGTMNVFLVTRDGELVTPGLGTILAGVTRDSLLRLAEEHGLTPVQRRIGITELRAACADGRVTEVFTAGTAAVVTPVVRLAGTGFDVTVGSGEPGERTVALREHLLDIQYGRAADPRGWMHPVP